MPVFAGGFNHGLARFERAAALRFLDDRDGETVLHRRSRIEELRLHIDRGIVYSEIVDADAWRIAYCLQDAVEQPTAAGHCSFFCFHEHDFNFLQWCLGLNRRSSTDRGVL